MGVPKFFRWISERYPKINQRIICPPEASTRNAYFPNNKDEKTAKTTSTTMDVDSSTSPSPKTQKERSVHTAPLPTIKPEFDRLYVDMNGIIHCCSHNNSNQIIENDDNESNSSANKIQSPKSEMTDEEIFTNIRYYLDRMITDIVQPLEVVYLAVDGVAPRAKLNQQRTRRFRAAKEIEISGMAHVMKRQSGDEFLTGKVHVGKKAEDDGAATAAAKKGVLLVEEEDDDDHVSFHSNCITPGSVFLDKCSRNIEEFLMDKLKHDPKYSQLKIIYSGPTVPGEGEHKIMEFIRHEKQVEGYNPNTRHCLAGQDGDLIMLGLATHEPHFALLRERVDFNQNAVPSLADELVQQSSTKESTSKYVDNHDFELLHLSILRDYISYEFETNDVISNSPFGLERTIDDFVFMTFLIGNDFLPPLPALNIADGAFDILFANYKKHRSRWMKEATDSGDTGPYLTHCGNITCGRRLQTFIEDISRQNEDSIITRRKSQQSQLYESIRRDDAKFNRVTPTIPTDEELEVQEREQRDSYTRMLEDMNQQFTPDSPATSFKPVVSNHHMNTLSKNTNHSKKKEKQFEPEQEQDTGIISNLMNLLQRSISPSTATSTPNYKLDPDEVQIKPLQTELGNDDIKGRYYYDKFKFTPYDHEKHLELRKCYIKTLVWCLSYYYKGCVSWSWFYKYHYAPMLSDLQDIDLILSEMKFSLDVPLKPFDQLLGCIPPSSAFILPKAYRFLMTSQDSPLIEYYPKDFDVDMNGARNPWEAVVLLPFIDIAALTSASETLIDSNALTEEEKDRNRHGVAHLLSSPSRGVVQDIPYTLPKLLSSSQQRLNPLVFEPKLKQGVKLHSPGFPTLRSAPIQTMHRRFIGLNIFGNKSRYRTAVLVLNEDIIPPSPPAISLGPKFIGTSIYYNYPFLQEGFVTAVADQHGIIRGKEGYIPWKDDKEKLKFDWLQNKITKELLSGNGTTGSGGWMISQDASTCIIYLRPLSGLEQSDNTAVKVYAQQEIVIPLPAAIWYPNQIDPRFTNIPAKLEKNPYQFVYKQDEVDLRRMEKLMHSSSPDASSYASKNTVIRGDHKRSSSRIRRQIRHYSSEFNTIQKPFQGGTTTTASSTTNALVRNNRRRYSSLSTTSSFNRVRYIGGGRNGYILGVTLFVAGMFSSTHAHWNPPSQNHLTYTQHNPLLSPPRPNIHEAHDDQNYESNVPELNFAHGTTTLAFKTKDAIITAVDSRATLGNFVGSRTVQKVLPITKYVLGTMAGGAADCSFWIRKLRSQAKLYELNNDGGSSMSVARISRTLANYLYKSRGLELSVGTMIVGYDVNTNEECEANIYYVDSSGARISGDVFAIGSGSTFALGVVDSSPKPLRELSISEGIVLALKAIRSATLRDAYSGGYINIYVVTNKGWKKVFSEDLALIEERDGDEIDWHGILEKKRV